MAYVSSNIVKKKREKKHGNVYLKLNNTENTSLCIA